MHWSTLHRRLLLLAAVIGVALVTGAARDTGYQALVAMKQDMARTTERVAIKQAQLHGMTDAVVVDVDVNIEVDRQAMANDLATAARERQAQTQALVADIVNQRGGGANPSERSATPRSTETGETIRFGLLNLDLDSNLVEEALDEAPANPEQPPVNVSVALPPEVFAQGAIAPGKSLTDYVTNVAIKIEVPAVYPDAAMQQLAEKVHEAVEIAQLTEQSPSDAINIEKLPAIPPPPPEAKPPVWQGYVDPANGFLGTILAAVVLGIMLLVGLFLLARVFGSMASNIRELKPAEPESAADSSEMMAAIEDKQEANDDEDGSSERFDQSSVANALTSEMRSIRDQFVELVQQDAISVGEALAEALSDSSGMNCVADLLSFVGYKNLQPALGLLPASTMNRLSQVITENGDDAGNILQGVEFAQKTYRDCVLRSSDGPDQARDDLRKSLLQLNHQQLEASAQQLNDAGLAAILQIMSQKRSNALIAKISADVLKGALNRLSEPLGLLLKDAPELPSILAEAAKVDNTKKNARRESFIMQLAANASLDDEDRIVALLSPKERELLRKVMKTRFFYRDLEHVPTEALRQVLDKLPTRARAEFLFVADEALRTRLLGTFDEGSKLRDLLTSELGEIEKNTKRQEAVAKGKEQTIRGYLHFLEKYLHSEPEVFEAVLRAKTGDAGVEEETPVASDENPAA